MARPNLGLTEVLFVRISKKNMRFMLKYTKAKRVNRSKFIDSLLDIRRAQVKTAEKR